MNEGQPIDIKKVLKKVGSVAWRAGVAVSLGASMAACNKGKSEAQVFAEINQASHQQEIEAKLRKQINDKNDVYDDPVKAPIDQNIENPTNDTRCDTLQEGETPVGVMFELDPQEGDYGGFETTEESAVVDYVGHFTMGEHDSKIAPVDGKVCVGSNQTDVQSAVLSENEEH